MSVNWFAPQTKYGRLTKEEPHPYTKSIESIAMMVQAVAFGICLHGLIQGNNKVLARSTIISKESYPHNSFISQRLSMADIFARANYDRENLVASLINRNAPCEQTACCAGKGHTNISQITDLRGCETETDRRWAEPFNKWGSPAGYSVLWLALLASTTSLFHHAAAAFTAAADDKGPLPLTLRWWRYIDYAISAPLILVALYQFVMVYDFAVQIMGFFLCSYSMVCAFRFENSAFTAEGPNWTYFAEGVCFHAFAWLPFVVNLIALNDSINENVATSESSVSSTGVYLAITGTIVIYVLYPLVTGILIAFDRRNSVYIAHTLLSAAAKNVLAIGVVEATHHF